MENETYYGIRIFRFYIKCTRCSAEITFKTDPKNTDYLCEHGAQRNFEPWREAVGEETEEEMLARIQRAEEEEKEDPMKSLENRTIDSKREMDILDKLQEIRGRNARLERADSDAVLERISSRRDPDLMDEEERLAEIERLQAEEEDEELVAKYFARGVVPPSEIELPDEDPTEPPGADEYAPIPGPSGIDHAEEAQPKAAKAPTAGPSVKRKFVDAEPDAISLLSDEARKIAESVTFKAPPLPKKKQKGAGSSLLGIKLKGK